MPTAAAVVTGTLPTSGAVSLTKSGFGTPTAAIIFVSNANTTNNPQDIGSSSVGIWITGNDQRGVGLCQDDGDADSDAASLGSTTEAVVICDDAGALLVSYTAAAVTDGIQLTLNAGSTGLARYVSALLIKGTTSVYIGTQGLGTGTAEQNITAVGFQPHLVFALMKHALAGGFAYGMAAITDAGAVTQRSMSFNNRIGRGSTETYTSVLNDRIASRYTSAGLAWDVDLLNPDSSGFSVQASASTASTNLYYLAIKFPDEADVHVGDDTLKTSTGTQAYTAAGMTPSALLLGSFFLRTAFGGGVRSTSASWAVGLADSTTQVAHTIRDAEYSTSADADARYSASKVLSVFGNTAVDSEATLDSLDSGGFTLDYTDAASSAQILLVLAIGDSTAGGGTTYTTSGALTAQAAVISGTASRSSVYTSVGALAAQSAVLSGAAAHLALHTSTGALVAGSAVVAGTAAHPHVAAGSLVAQTATLAGSADHTAPGAFDTDGALVAGTATLAGTAVRLALHTTTGVLAADAATLAATAVHTPAHQTTGALVAQSAIVAGASEHTVPGVFSTAGELVAQTAVVAGTAAHLTLHTTTGALTAGSAVIAGSSIHVGSGFATEGVLVAQSASMAGVALRASAPEPADTTFTLRRSAASGSLRHSYRGKPARRGLE